MLARELLHHPIDTVRTAPVAFLGMSAFTGMSASMVNLAMETDGNLEATGWGMAAVTAGLALRGISLARKSMELRQRLEDSLAVQGFNDRIFATTTQEWCTRQAATVACEQYDADATYADLCERSKDGAAFSWLPQI